MIAVFLVMGAIGTVAVPQTVTDRSMYTVNQGATNHARLQVGNVRLDSSTSARLQSWEDAVVDWKETPIWGYGITGYIFLDAQYPRVLVETGILGVVTFFGLILAVYRQGYTLYRDTTAPFIQGFPLACLQV
jgi:O-antigen ligase